MTLTGTDVVKSSSSLNTLSALAFNFTVPNVTTGAFAGTAVGFGVPDFEPDEHDDNTNKALVNAAKIHRAPRREKVATDKSLSRGARPRSPHAFRTLRSVPCVAVPVGRGTVAATDS